MKSKKILIFLVMIFASICLFSFSNKVNAASISDDGEYTLILGLSTDDFYSGDIDGESLKLIRFNVAEGETTVKLSELTRGVVPFNGKNEFSHWITNDKKEASEELNISEFKENGTIWTTKEENYTKGLSLEAKFEGKALKETGNYYLYFDAFAGTINGKSKITIKNKASDFKTIDLKKYTPVRKGYTFKGWDVNGKLVKSIDSSAFAKDAVVNLTATYTKDTFDSDYLILKLDANGGTIEGKSSNRYDYIAGANSGTNMSLLPYIPVREGYTFNGWNAKKDGSGKKYKYMYWASWRNEDGFVPEFERDTLNDDKSMYKNITLYATWTKNADTPTTPQQPSKETVKEIQSTGETKANIEFENEVSKNYKLDIKPVEIKKDLTDKSVKYMVDINVLDGNNIVKISDTKMKIKIELPEDLKGYNQYEVVYISNDEIKETIPATVKDGYIVFETSHLSQYGIVAKNVEQEDNTKTTSTSKNETNNPKTADNIITNVMLFMASIIAISTLAIVNKNKQQSK